MKTILTAAAIASLSATSCLSEPVPRNTFTLEGGAAFTAYNDAAVPGDNGTRIGLGDELDGDPAPALRLRYGRTFQDRHWAGLLAAPLTARYQGTLSRDTDFDGSRFPAGSRVNASFRFDSYRLVYRYLASESDLFSLRLGAALKVRDAAITLESEGIRAEKRNTGLVPLLSFNLTWRPWKHLHVLLDGEALAAPQGRAEDVLLAVSLPVDKGLSLYGGYRVLEGGADNDEVYTFSLFHYLVAGASWTW